MIDHQHGVLAAIPAGDRAVLGDKDEARGDAVGKNKIGAAIENRAGWSGGGTSRSVLWRRDGNGSSAIDGDAYARTGDRKSTRLNSSHTVISYAVFCLKKKKKKKEKK